MKLLNRRGRFMIHFTPDGGYDRPLSTVIPTLSATRRTLRELQKLGYRADDMSIEDKDQQIYISMVW